MTNDDIMRYLAIMLLAFSIKIASDDDVSTGILLFSEDLQMILLHACKQVVSDVAVQGTLSTKRNSTTPYRSAAIRRAEPCDGLRRLSPQPCKLQSRGGCEFQTESPQW